jgi:predicted PurR-regulated permease PerM
MKTQLSNIRENAHGLSSIFLGIIVLFLVVWVLILGQSIIIPFLIALFLSVLLDPFINLLQRLKIPISISVIIAILVSFIFLYLMGMMVYVNVEVFAEQFPVYKIQMVNILNSISIDLEKMIGKPLSLPSWKSIDWIGALQKYSIAGGIVSSIGNFLTFLMKMLMVFIFVAFILTGKQSVDTKILQAFPGDEGVKILDVLQSIMNQVQTYLATKTLVSFITGLISLIVFSFFGLDFAVFWAFVIFIFNFIPNIGSILGTVLPFLFSFIQFGSVTISFWLLVIVGLLQFSIGNIIETKLKGKSLNLSPIMVIISLIFWGYIWGVAGMILSVPILATFAIITENVSSLKFISVFIRGKV